jgi:predicted alpha/beta-fold hydrolase
MPNRSTKDTVLLLPLPYRLLRPSPKVSVWDAFCGLFRGYEKTVFVPLWGLRDIHEYHERASAHTMVSNIARPLLVVHARDDPVVPVESLPLEQVSV